MPLPEYTDVENAFDVFWNSAAASNTSMYGLVDLWEGPLEDGGGAPPGNNTVMAIDTYKNNVYVFYGGGIKSWIKVITPDGPILYELGALPILMTQSIHPKYFSMAVLNENEIIAGYIYINLEHQFMAPFGLDLSQLYKNPSFNISNFRLSDGAWITAVRDVSGWKMITFAKASPDDCLPCASKKMYAKQSFECKEIEYSREPLLAMGHNNGTMAYSGVGIGTRVPTPVVNPEKCARAMNQYAAIFNHQKISPDDVGIVGTEMSRYCSSAMYRNMVNVSEYKTGSEKLMKEYLEELIRNGHNDINMIRTESAKLTGIIGEYLYEIRDSLGENDFTRGLMRDTSWWGPIWFNANQGKLGELSDDKSAYSLLYYVDMVEDFIPLLKASAKKPSSATSGFSGMGWILVGKQGSALSKYGIGNMTYFKFPKSICISGVSVGRISGPRTISGVCGVETRPDGIYFWAWKYSISASTISLYRYSNDGVFTNVASASAPGTPTSNSPMSVSLSGDKWKVHDFFYTGSGISSVSTEVEMSKAMQTLTGYDEISWYANYNETVGPWAAPDNAYGDGLLESHPGRFDLGNTSPLISQGRVWGNDGPQFDIRGYTGYQIKSASNL